MENKNLIRISMFIFILFSLFTLGFSHDGEDHSINQNVGNPISPLHILLKEIMLQEYLL